MTVTGVATLYTPELLALAVSLADYPLSTDAPFRGEARSPTCGSRVALATDLHCAQVVQPGLRVTACAVGQAAAAIFIRHAAGKTRDEIVEARRAIAGWLAGSGPLPDWPGFAALASAGAYPGRHGAIPLAWDAALAALPKETASG